MEKKPTRYIHVSELNKGPKKRREKLPVRYSPSQKNDQYRSSEKGQIGEGDGNMYSKEEEKFTGAIFPLKKPTTQKQYRQQKVATKYRSKISTTLSPLRDRGR